MSMDINISVFGDKEIAKKFQQLSNQKEVLESSVLSGSLLVQNSAKEKAPYRTGNLRRSIHAEILEATNTRAKAKVGTDVEYARPVEYGTKNRRAKPYLRPALHENKQAVINEIRDALREQIEAVFK